MLPGGLLHISFRPSRIPHLVWTPGLVTRSEDQDMSNKFKTAQGRRLTKGMFYETVLADKSTVLYTLKEQDHEGFPSLKRLYLECGDPTEYKFATAYLDSWSHWVELCKCTWFQEYLELWRAELELKVKSKALYLISEEASNDLSKSKFAANKFLIEGGWKPRETSSSGRGRPSKKDIQAAANKIASDQAVVDDAVERVLN